jgi:WD40 repeat protein
VSGGVDKNVNIWQSKSDKLVRTLEKFPSCVRSILFSIKSEFLIVGGNCGTIKVWNCSDWSIKYSSKEHSSVIFGLTLIPNTLSNYITASY